MISCHERANQYDEFLLCMALDLYFLQLLETYGVSKDGLISSQHDACEL